MGYHWLPALALLLCPALAEAVDDRAWLVPALKRAMSKSATTCAAGEAKGKVYRGAVRRRCRLAPDSAIVPQVTIRNASRAPWTSGSFANGVASVPQLLGSAVRSPKRRRDGDAVEITGNGGCPRRLPVGYACIELDAERDLFVRALVESPSARTLGTLEMLHLPAIQGVPPIVVINPDRDRPFDPDMPPGLFFDFGVTLP